MQVWYFVRFLYLWLPFELFLTISAVFVIFVVLFLVKLWKLILDLIPFVG